METFLNILLERDASLVVVAVKIVNGKWEKLRDLPTTLPPCRVRVAEITGLEREPMYWALHLRHRTGERLSGIVWVQPEASKVASTPPNWTGQAFALLALRSPTPSFQRQAPRRGTLRSRAPLASRVPSLWPMHAVSPAYTELATVSLQGGLDSIVEGVDEGLLRPI